MPGTVGWASLSVTGSRHRTRSLPVLIPPGDRASVSFIRGLAVHENPVTPTLNGFPSAIPVQPMARKCRRFSDCPSHQCQHLALFGD